MKSVFLILIFFTCFLFGTIAQSKSISDSSNIDISILTVENLRSVVLDSQLKYDSPLKEFTGRTEHCSTKGVVVDSDKRLQKTELNVEDEGRGTMPVYIPKGDFPMPVSVPDTAKNYSLLIKEMN
ncbi:MAG: hypothetical protein JEZ14_05950 [Marinilabiliaceae bacterium]|nr:hypothetical protein [Marinilabiliaceae bacterium]